MVKLGEIGFGFGQVSYHQEVEPKAATSETSQQGNVSVNIHNKGQPGTPEHYEVTFMLNCKFEDDSIHFSNIFHWTAVVARRGKDTSYSTVEAEAARKIAPMLREVAQRIEDSVTKYDQKLE